MSYVGNVPTTAAFPFDQFSGNGSTTAFTLSYAPAGTTSIIVSISGVVQNPNTYSVSGTTLTFAPAPPTGTNNIAVLYLGLPVVATLTPGNTAYFTRSVFTATASQTVFTPSGTYQVGFVNVIRNGATLAPADYTATNGTTVTLLNACAAGDTVVIEVYNLVSIANALPATGGTVTGATTFNSTLAVNGANVSGFTGFKNRIINPGMVIDQRNAGASVTITNTANVTYTLDRFFGYGSQASRISIQQNAGSVTPPTGFSNYLGVISLAATTPGASDYYEVGQRIEGFNTADLAWGTANAQTVTLSFWVRSSLTGTFGGAIRNSTSLRSYAFSYTVSSANTWTLISVTIPGDTSGTWQTTTGIGIIVSFGLGAGSSFTGAAGSWAGATYIQPTGSVSVVGTNGATWYITGVQLERGSNATSYEFRSYGQELALCQRYLPAFNSTGTTSQLGVGMIASSTVMTCELKHPVPTRVAPTSAAVSSISHITVYTTGINTVATSLGGINTSNTLSSTINLSASGWTGGQGAYAYFNNASGQLLLNGCEL